MDPTYQGFGAPIPTTKPYRRGGSGKFIAVIAGGLIVIIIAVVLLLNTGDTTGNLQLKLAARLDTLAKIVTEGNKNAKDPDLREINSVISIQTLSDAAALKSAMKNPKPNEQVKAAEADKASFDDLKNAALNNRFDSEYRKIIAAKLDSTNALIKEIYEKSSNKTLKNALDQVYRHFQQLQSQLAASSSS